ncbi:MAG: TIGR03790 family protein [Candidatus Schekmanbacteria bacterium]|nr:TIGR03790 family protein [Candidatus Schekmanbacteria bacterium]
MLKIKLLILGIIIFYTAIPASAIEPNDLLIIYNKNYEQSKEVAEYYAKKRAVPAINLIGVDLPEKEKISRETYEEDLYPHIYNAAASLKKAGRNPALLLVYGMPLVVSKADFPAVRQHKKQVIAKIEELTSILAQLNARLDELISNQIKPVKKSQAEGMDNLPDMLNKIQRTLAQTSEYRKKFPPESPLPKNVEEIESIIIRMVGLAPLVQEIERKANDKMDNILNLGVLMENQLLRVFFLGATFENAPELASTMRIARGLAGEAKFWYSLKDFDPGQESSASLESELSLILAEPYVKAKWLPNPFQKQFDKLHGIEQIRDKVLKVARLDAPTPASARRLVDDSLWAEDRGLKGVFYLDARGNGVKKMAKAYQVYDQYIQNLHTILKEKTHLPVVMDSNAEVFPENACPDTALYCGWYSRGKYVAAFKWQRGAVGFHVASSEAATLKDKDSQVWCKRMLEEGIAATLGPVQEPYLHSFPRPDHFFPLLLSGKAPLIDVYYRTIPLLSWRQVLIGDPLYNPFKKHPAIDLESGEN